MKNLLWALCGSLLFLAACSSATEESSAGAAPGDPNATMPGANGSGAASGAGGSAAEEAAKAEEAAHDGTQNSKETDVDCGGPGKAKRCEAGKKCKEHADCASNACAFDGTCAMGASCTKLEGGHTCGPNDGMTKQADCCDRAKVGAFTVDKYLVTAGRMRAFLERVNGNVRDFASKLPGDKWDPSFTDRLPTAIDGEAGDESNANTQLGPFFGKRSCQSGSHTGHTFWTPEKYGDLSDFPREVLDTKALNCVPWWLLAALCAFDGGHLLLEKELRAAYTNNDTGAMGGLGQYPWGARGSYTTTAMDDHAVQLFSYATPDPPASARRDQDGFLDVAFHIAPPGRRPLGYNKTGHADLVGNLLEWVGDSDRQFVWKGSFERHSQEADRLNGPLPNDPYLAKRSGVLPWRWTDVVRGASDPENVNGYYAIGGRCAY